MRANRPQSCDALATWSRRIEDSARGRRPLVRAPGSDLPLSNDALLQDPARRPAVESAVIAPLADLLDGKAERASRQAAATKVEFFTLVRGDA